MNEIEREPEAWGAVRFKFVRITSSYLLSVGPWCDGLICSALPVVTVYVRVLRETVQIERQWAVQHFTPQPAWLSHLEANTHTQSFFLAEACSTYCLYHIIALTPVKSSELRLQANRASTSTATLTRSHPSFYPHLLQFLQFLHIFPLNKGLWLQK